MKKTILTLGFLVAISTISLAQTNEDAAKPKNNNTAQPGKAETTPNAAGSADQNQRQDVQRAGDPANPNGGVQISTPDPRVESPAKPTTPQHEPAPVAAPRPANESRPVPPPSQPQPAKKPSAETKPAPVNETRPITPQPATQPKKQEPAKTQKTQTPR